MAHFLLYKDVKIFDRTLPALPPHYPTTRFPTSTPDHLRTRHLMGEFFENSLLYFLLQLARRYISRKALQLDSLFCILGERAKYHNLVDCHFLTTEKH
jgi:hypothetical protein